MRETDGTVSADVLAARLVEKYALRSLRCATAESCTGGGVGAAVTAVPGSSAVYCGGVVSYDNSVKQAVLGVPGTVLETFGAVSAQCASYMAEGVRRLTGADVAVSVTGIAGPGGGSPAKPVGRVYFAISGAKGTVVFEKTFSGDRAAVRSAAVLFALDALLAAVDGEQEVI